VCAFSLSYPTRSAHAPYSHLLPVWFYIIFLHYLINGSTFVEKVTEHEMCVLLLAATSLTNLHFQEASSKV